MLQNNFRKFIQTCPKASWNLSPHFSRSHTNIGVTHTSEGHTKRGSVRKRKFPWNLEENCQPPTKISHSNTWHQSQGDTRTNDRIRPIWSDLESDYALKSNDPFHGKVDAHMDDGINEKTRRWAAANSYAVGKSPYCDERRQQIHNLSQKESWEQVGRGRSSSWGWGKNQSPSPSPSPVRDLNWESYEEIGILRNGSRELSQPLRNFAAGRWRRGSQCRGRCGSNNGSQNRSRNQSSVQNHKQESHVGSERNLSESRELSKPCRNFGAGRCSRGHHCRSLHQDEHMDRDRTHTEIGPAESWGSGYDYGRAFRYDSGEEMYMEYPRDKASRGYGSSCDEGGDEPLKNISRSTDVCQEFLNGKCHRGSSCKYVHCSSGRKFDISNGNHHVDHEFKHKRILGNDTLCKYFVMGKCRDGDYCRFSHGGASDYNSEGQSKDYRWGKDLTDKNIIAISDNAKSSVWGNSVKNMDFIESVVVENSSYSRRGHRLPIGYGTEYERSSRNALLCHDRKHEAHQFGATLCKYYAMGECRYGDQCSFLHDVPTHRKANGQSKYDGRGHDMDNETKLWDGRTWDDIDVVSDAAMSTGWGNRDAGNMNCTNALNAKSLTYNRKPKGQSRDGKWTHASDGGKKLWNGPPWGDISSISDASKCTSQGNRDVGKSKFTDEMAAENFTYYRPGHSLSYTSGNEHLRSNTNVPHDHNHKPAANESGHTLCKYFAVGNCRDGGRCRFSHGGPAHKKPKCQSRDGRRAHVSDDGKTLWNGPTWDNVSAVSQAAKFSGWGHSNVRNIGFTNVVAEGSTFNRLTHGLDNENSSCGTPVLKDKAWESDEHQSSELPNGSCGAITGVPESMVAEKIYVKEETQSIPVPSLSRKPNGTGDDKNFLKSSEWDDNTAVSDASKCTRQGISDVGKIKFTDETTAENSTYHRPGHSWSDTSGNEYLRRNKNAPSGHNRKPESHENADMLCKYFATRKCRDGDRCRFSHGGIAHRKSKCQSRDDVSDNGKKSWNGATWDDVSAVSAAAKVTGWGYHDDRNMDFTDVVAVDSISHRLAHGLDNKNSSCGSLVLKDKVLESDEYQSYELASGSGGAIRGIPESMATKTFSVKEEPQSVLVPSQSQKLNGTDNDKNLWNGLNWDDIAVVSDASKCTRQGIRDVGKMKFTDGMTSENSTYHRPGHYLCDTSGNEYLRSNKNAPSDYNHKPKSHENGDMLCKYFATRNCRDGDRCRFSHGGFAQRKSKFQSQDGRQAHVTDDGKKLWNGPRWDDVSAVSQVAKFTGWGNDDVRNMNYTVASYSSRNRLDHCLDKGNKSCGSPVLKDKAVEGEEFSELASESGGAIMGDPESIVAAKVFVKEEPQTIQARSQTQNLNGTDIPSDWDVTQETSNLQLGATVAHSTLSEGSNVEQHFIDGGNNNALATCSCSQNEVNLSEKIVHSAVVTRQNFKQEGDSLGSELDSNFYESSQDKQILSSNPSISSLYTSHVNGLVQQKVSHFHLQSQMQYPAEYSETAAVLKFKIPQVTCGTPLSPLDPLSKPANTTESLLSNSTEEQNGLPKRPKSIEIHKNSSSEQEYHDSLKLKGLKPIEKENSQTLPDKFKQQQEGGHLENADADGRAEEGNRNNDDKMMQIFTNALVEVVKEILCPTWKEGRISKDIYKTILKKVVDKVCGAIQSVDILKTRENIDHYLSSFKPNITKLVQGYLEIYPKSSFDDQHIS